MSAGSAAPFCLTRSDIEEYFTSLGLPYKTVTHDPVDTVEELMKLESKMPGFHHKHMFLKDKKTGECILLVARHDRSIDLNAVGKILGFGSGRLRFAPEETLYEKLGVRKGSVNVYSVINDKPREVKLVLDSEILAKTDKLLWFHPMENNATTGISVDALKTFLGKTGHKAILLQFAPDKSLRVVTV